LISAKDATGKRSWGRIRLVVENDADRSGEPDFAALIAYSVAKTWLKERQMVDGRRWIEMYSLMF
jgi:hypothetical protein